MTTTTSTRFSSLRRLPALLSAAALVTTGLAAAPLAQATPTPDGRMDITITQSGAPQDGIYAVGDVMTFDISVTSNLSDAAAFRVRSTNLGGGVSACRWTNFPAGQTRECNGQATHVVTQEDLASGGFTPSVAYETLDVGYNGTATASEAVSGPAVPVTGPMLDVVSFTNQTPQDTYAVGDQVTYQIRVKVLASTVITVEATGSSFDDLADQCTWRNLPTGAAGVYNCKDLSHVMTDEDGRNGAWTPSITLQAKDPATGAVLQTRTLSGTALPVAFTPPPAQPATEPGVDPSLPSEFTSSTVLAANTSANNYRIPAITSAPNGDLLVSYDERPRTGWDVSGGDAPNPNSIVQRRSTDNGVTWGEPTYVHQGSKDSRDTRVGFSDPSYVVDWQTGAIFNFHVKSYNTGFFGSQAGSDVNDRNVLQAEVSVSRDNGYTWEHQVITPQVTPDASWISRFAASGQGIQLKYGAYAGRLVQQFTIKKDDGSIQAVSVYSDDHGATWQAGEAFGTRMDENKVVELSDGTLLLNSRDNAGGGYRKIARSSDGGRTWGEVTPDYQLKDPTNNGQVIRAYPSAPAGSPQSKVLLFTNSATWSGRTYGTIKMSCDDGATWASAKTYNTGHVGYTTIAVQSDGHIGLATEEGGNTISYNRLSMSWLGGVCAPLSANEVSLSTKDTHATVSVWVTNQSADTLSGVVSLDLPTGVTAEGATVSDLAPGAYTKVDIPLTIAAGALSQGYVEVTATFTTSTGAASTGTIWLKVDDPDHVDRSHLSIGGFSSQNLGGGEYSPATNVIDGDTSTFWHSQWSGAVAQPPHYVTLKIDALYDVTRLGYVPRTDNLNGAAEQYVVNVARSTDGTCPAEDSAWRQAASGTLTKPVQTTIDLQGATGVDCVQFVIKTDQAKGSVEYGSAAEINLFGTPSSSPSPSPSSSPSVSSSPSPSASGSSSSGGGGVVPGVMPVFVARVAADGTGSVLVGDWDGDGVRSYGVRVGSRVVFYSENSVLAAPVASLSLGRVSDRVFVGDWDGDGRDTLALVRGRSVFYQQVMDSSATTAGRVPEGELVVARQGDHDVLIAR